MAVQIIKARKNSTNIRASEAGGGHGRLRVSAYARISTDKEGQESSYEIQCEHYTRYIRQNPQWEFAGLYADEGISGTQAKKRPEFMRMIHDCEAHQIDLILTKSLSRWARNTLDSLQYIRKLKELGIAVIFEKESINTMTAQGEVLITIMSSIAQQESESISQNIRLGIRYRMQQGKSPVNTSRLLGYDSTPGQDTLSPVAKEADIVRRIYREYLEGLSPALICRRLEADKVLTGSGGSKWYPSTIASMLENEKYMGDLLLQKYYTADVITHHVKRNTGQLPQYYIKDHHPPIIPKEIYYQVQRERLRRSAFKNDPLKIRRGSHCALSGRLVCGRCRRILKRYKKPDPSRTDWRCRRRSYSKMSNHMEMQQASSCKLRFIKENDAKNVVLEAFNQLPSYYHELVNRKNSLRQSLTSGPDTNFRRTDLSEMTPEERTLILTQAEIYDQEMKIRLLLECIDQLISRHKGASDDWNTDGLHPITPSGNLSGSSPGNGSCSDYEDFFMRTLYRIPDNYFDSSGKLAVFDDDMVIRYLKQVIVQDLGYELEFKAGITIRISSENFP